MCYTDYRGETLVGLRWVPAIVGWNPGLLGSRELFTSFSLLDQFLLFLYPGWVGEVNVLAFLLGLVNPIAQVTVMERAHVRVAVFLLMTILATSRALDLVVVAVFCRW